MFNSGGGEFLNYKEWGILCDFDNIFVPSQLSPASLCVWRPNKTSKVTGVFQLPYFACIMSDVEDIFFAFNQAKIFVLSKILLPLGNECAICSIGESWLLI